MVAGVPRGEVVEGVAGGDPDREGLGEDGHVGPVLLGRFVSGVVRDLLADTYARDRTSANRSTSRKSVLRECPPCAVGHFEPPPATFVESNGMHVDSATRLVDHLEASREAISFDLVSVVQQQPMHVENASERNQHIQVSMGPRLVPQEGVDPPAARDPMDDPGVVEKIDQFEHV